jgi:hypothetical protein
MEKTMTNTPETLQQGDGYLLLFKMKRWLGYKQIFVSFSFF